MQVIFDRRNDTIKIGTYYESLMILDWSALLPMSLTLSNQCLGPMQLPKFRFSYVWTHLLIYSDQFSIWSPVQRRGVDRPSTPGWIPVVSIIFFTLMHTHAIQSWSSKFVNVPDYAGLASQKLFVTRMALSRAHTSAKAADQVIPQSAAWLVWRTRQLPFLFFWKLWSWHGLWSQPAPFHDSLTHSRKLKIFWFKIHNCVVTSAILCDSNMHNLISKSYFTVHRVQCISLRCALHFNTVCCISV